MASIEDLEDISMQDEIESVLSGEVPEAEADLSILKAIKSVSAQTKAQKEKARKANGFQQLRKDGSIDDAMKAMVKALGKDRSEGIQVFTSAPAPIPRFSSGSMQLDWAIGGGWPIGRAVEIYGDFSSGKTTMATLAAAEMIKTGGKVLYLDVENAVDLNYAAKLGMDLSQVMYINPDSTEDMWDACILALKQGYFSLIVIDSLAQCASEAQLGGGMRDQFMAVNARLHGNALAQVIPLLRKSKCTLMMINQIREGIGAYVSPISLPGGKGPKFASSIMVKTGLIKEKKNFKDVFATIKFQVVKNKTAPPNREVESKLVFGQGIDIYPELLVFAEKLGIINRAGAFYKYEGENIGQGSVKAALWLEDQPELCEEIKAGVLTLTSDVDLEPDPDVDEMKGVTDFVEPGEED